MKYRRSGGIMPDDDAVSFIDAQNRRINRWVAGQQEMEMKKRGLQGSDATLDYRSSPNALPQVSLHIQIYGRSPADARRQLDQHRAVVQTLQLFHKLALDGRKHLARRQAFDFEDRTAEGGGVRGDFQFQPRSVGDDAIAGG